MVEPVTGNGRLSELVRVAAALLAELALFGVLWAAGPLMGSVSFSRFGTWVARRLRRMLLPRLCVWSDW